MQSERTVHQGRNVKRIREMLGIKQDALALELGEDWNQKKISLLEQKESIETPILVEVAKALKVPVEALESFNEDAAINFISNTFHDTKGLINYYPTFNPIDKLMEALEENKKLYTSLMKEKDEKIALLERMLKEK